MNDSEDTYRQWGERRFALDQSTHEAINARHYPGTRQLCSRCSEPTGRCEDDSIHVGDEGPLCEECVVPCEQCGCDILRPEDDAIEICDECRNNPPDVG